MTETLKLIYDKLSEKKAEDIKIIDISEISVMADHFIIASGNNVNQLHAMTDFVEEELAKAGFEPKSVEGYNNANWILMDYRDFIIHIFDKESREFYDLERIWKGGKIVEI
ncbi:MAG: ribosome silencing factor [Lachnospiraceae bacterium]|nr:ribosome silencing factor [Lachnospiraceae bacterium]